MGVTARDVMDTDFHTVRPENTIAEAVKAFKQASEQRRQKVFGLMVTDDRGLLVGMLSLYDMLLLMRPKNIHIWGKCAISMLPVSLRKPAAVPAPSGSGT